MSKGLFHTLGVVTPFDPEHSLVTSPFFSPLVLAIIRLTLALYALITVLVILIWDATKLHVAERYFSYFTSLSYIGLLAYFWASGVQTLAFALRGGKSYPLQRWPRTLQFLHMLLYSTIVTFPLVVTIVFWSLLSSSGTFSTKFSSWSNVSQHALNSAFALFEILLTNVAPMPWIHVPFLIILLGAYLGVAYITFASQGFYTYSFLDPVKQGNLLAAYIVGIAAGEVVIFVVVRLVCMLRARLARGLRPAYRQSVVSEAIDEWEEVDPASVSGMA
ncbi:hypothetical protein NLI96_g11975 [Meripilus lineatus]|uniref:FAR-17a/AIG1-like protein n=1 Tax=Meripilus lineatus TaxID=2056292 RepID=A0AAD5USF0_9APHY|nr:hypothetical protein NLI96_g11975 [Physisporinus lineatus]